MTEALIAMVGQVVGVRTNERGEFRLRVREGEVSLIVRAIGYKRQTVRVPASQSAVDVVMVRDVLELEGVTVTGVATSVEKRNAATAYVTINNDEITRVPAASLEAALQGKVVGASININNGAPGGGGQIQIRGASSLIGKIDPLFVVDGVIISNAVRGNSLKKVTGSLNPGEENGTNRLADLNQNDIETIEVLKGAAASAVYGSQATNGVIVITTKKGSGGAPRFNLQQSVGSSQVIRTRGTRLFNTADKVKDLQTNVGGDGAEIDAAIAASCSATSCKYYDYLGDLYGRTDPTFETVISMTGGAGATRYFASAHDRQEPGIALNTGARRQSVRANVDAALGSKFTFNLGSNVLHSFSQRGISNNDNSFASPIYGIAYTPAVLNLNTRDAAGRYPLNPFPSGYAGSANPFQTFSLLTNNEDVYRMILSGRVNYAAFSKGSNNINLSFNGGADRFSNEGYIVAPQELEFQRLGTGIGGSFPGTVIQGNGTSVLSNATLGGVWTFTPGKFSSTFSAGGQFEERRGNDYTIIGRGLGPQQQISSGAAKTEVDQGQSSVRNQAFYGQEELLMLGEKLYVSAAVRGERSSVNGDRNQIFYFPRFATSYRIVSPFKTLDEVKLRANFGQSGNQSGYGSRDVVVANYGIIGGQTGYGIPATIGNPNIRPERLAEQEYGVDVSMFSQRAHFEVTYFSRHITDLLVTPQLATSTGVAAKTVNGGTMESKGWEVGTSFVPIQDFHGFQWLTRVNWTQNSARITSFPAGVLPFTIGAAGGFGNSYGRLRFTAGNSTSAIYGNYTDPVTKKVKDNTLLGDANPRYVMNFSNEFSRKNWTLSVLMDYRNGGTVSNMTLNIFDEGHNTWDYDSPSPKAGIPLGQYRYDLWNGGRNTQVYLVDGSYVKVREISLGYDLPASWVKMMPSARTARASFSGRNLFIISPYNGFDPEVNNGGNQVARFVDLAPFPPSRRFEFKLNVGF